MRTIQDNRGRTVHLHISFSSGGLSHILARHGNLEHGGKASQFLFTNVKHIIEQGLTCGALSNDTRPGQEDELIVWWHSSAAIGRNSACTQMYHLMMVSLVVHSKRLLHDGAVQLKARVKTAFPLTCRTCDSWGYNLKHCCGKFHGITSSSDLHNTYLSCTKPIVHILEIDNVHHNFDCAYVNCK
jgi:hypothetical protein